MATMFGSSRFTAFQILSADRKTGNRQNTIDKTIATTVAGTKYVNHTAHDATKNAMNAVMTDNTTAAIRKLNVP